jgi:hypothetical protein
MARMNSVPFTQAHYTRGPFGAGLPIGLVLHRTGASYDPGKCQYIPNKNVRAC